MGSHLGSKMDSMAGGGRDHLNQQHPHFRTEQKSTIAKRNTNRSLIKDAFDIEEDDEDDAIDESQLLTVQQILTSQ